MRFLIDECLHLDLVKVARQEGYEANHIIWLGKGGHKDWDLMPFILDNDYVLVTNNCVEFRKRYDRKAPLHAGIVLIIPNVKPEIQQKLFLAALLHIKGCVDIVNKAIEVDLSGEQVSVKEYDIPARPA